MTYEGNKKTYTDSSSDSKRLSLIKTVTAGLAATFAIGLLGVKTYEYIAPSGKAYLAQSRAAIQSQQAHITNQAPQLVHTNVGRAYSNAPLVDRVIATNIYPRFTEKNTYTESLTKEAKGFIDSFRTYTLTDSGYADAEKAFREAAYFNEADFAQKIILAESLKEMFGKPTKKPEATIKEGLFNAAQGIILSDKPHQQKYNALRESINRYKRLGFELDPDTIELLVECIPESKGEKNTDAKLKCEDLLLPANFIRVMPNK